MVGLVYVTIVDGVDDGVDVGTVHDLKRPTLLY